MKTQPQTQMLELSAEDARVLFVAIEHMANYEKGAGRVGNSDRLWALFQKIEAMHFYVAIPETP